MAEANKGAIDPVYVIGTEVPVPGGAAEALDHLEVTKPESVKKTYAVHETAFGGLGLQDAFGRVVALVVQPGVEFGHSDVVHYDRAAARDLTACLDDLPGVVFEAHSTDYQTAGGLRALVEDGFAILKVGPWVTFALREALYSMDAVADVLDGKAPMGQLMATIDRVMRDRPENWQKYYEGTEKELWLQRHFSLSDRIRYYWPDPAASQAVDLLYQRVSGKSAPIPVAHQYCPWFETDTATAPVELGPSAVIASVQKVLAMYSIAEGL